MWLKRANKKNQLYVIHQFDRFPFNFSEMCSLSTIHYWIVIECLFQMPTVQESNYFQEEEKKGLRRGKKLKMCLQTKKAE